MNDAKPKRTLLPTGGNTKQRIMVVAAGALILIILALVVGAILSSGGNNSVKDLTALAKQQTELARIANYGVTSSRDSTTQNLALTAKLSIESDQLSTISLLNGLGVKLSTKDLSSTKNPRTDALLAQAQQVNQFDSVFANELKAELAAYQQAVKQAYNDASKPTTKQALAIQYQHAQLLANKSQTGASN